MKRSERALSVAPRTRPGFTLVELLIVITIIAALMALAVSASMRFINVAEVRNTETLVRKVHDVFDKHWKAVITKANQEQVPQAVLDFAAPASSPSEQAQRARVLYVKSKLLREFPMTIDEATHAQDTTKAQYLLPPNPYFVKALQGLGATGAAENAGCLLLALTQARSGIVTNEEDFGAGTTRDMITGANKPAVKGFVDFWGQPVVFCRWPTGNAEVAALNPATPNTAQAKAFRDPQDANGLLIPWAKSANGQKWRVNVHPIVDASGKAAIFTVPVIWSSGPDKKLGLNLKDMGGTSGDANDNVYSYRLRLGGS